MQIYQDPGKRIQHFIQHGAWWNSGFVWTFMLFEHSWCWREKIVEWGIEWNLNEFKISSNISSSIWVLKQCWIRLRWQSNKLDNLPEATTFRIFYQKSRIFYHSNWLYETIKTRINIFQRYTITHNVRQRWKADSKLWY